MSPHARQQCRHSGKLVWSSDCSQNALTRFNDKKPNTKQTHAQQRPFTVRQAYAMLNTAGLDNYSYAREKKQKHTSHPCLSKRFGFVDSYLRSNSAAAEQEATRRRRATRIGDGDLSPCQRGRASPQRRRTTFPPAAAPLRSSVRSNTREIPPTHTPTHTRTPARTRTYTRTLRPVDWTDTRYLQLI